MIEHFGQVDAHPCDTQMVVELQLYCPDLSIPPSLEVSTWIKCTPYYALVESLNYVAVATCPNITFTVGQLGSFLECYYPKHWSVAV